MWITGQQVHGQAPPVACADDRRERRQSEPRSNGLGQPARVLGCPEVLGEPALGVEAGVFDLAVAVEQHNGGARRRAGGERADEPLARLRIPQRDLTPGRTRSSTSRSRSENWRSLRPSPATTISRRSTRTAIAMAYSMPDGWSRSPYSSLWDKTRAQRPRTTAVPDALRAACADSSG